MATIAQRIAANGLAINPGAYFAGSYVSGLVALAGGGQAGATLLSANLCVVATVATAADSVILPSLAQITANAPGPQVRKGVSITVINSGANDLAVFGATGDTINGGSANASVTVKAGAVAAFHTAIDGAWLSGTNQNQSFSTLTLSGNLLESATSGITAGTTRTQAGATLLTKQVNRVDTSTTASSAGLGDGVALPASVAGLAVIVHNNTANVIQVYGTGADTINGATNTVGIAQAPGSVLMYACTVAGTWGVEGSTKAAGFNTVNNTTSFTLNASSVVGGTASVDVALTGTLGSGQNVTLPAAAAVVAAMHNPAVGSSFRLRLINQSSANFAWTVLAGTGNTLTGATATIAQNASREYVVTVTAIGTPALTYQNVANATWN